MHKKANAAVIVLVIILLVVIISWGANFAGRGCSKDADCGTDYYCGSDFECHEFKIIEKTEVHYDLLLPAAIIGMAIIIAAIIWKKA